MMSTWNYFLTSAYWPWFWGIVGLIIGSFLNVVILRLPARMEWQWKKDMAVDQGQDEEDFVRLNPSPPDLVYAQSRCMKCGHQIKPWENIPVLGYLWLRGKCAGCKDRFSIQYPLIEALTGALFFACAWFIPNEWYAISLMVFCAMAIALAGIDIRVQLLPDSIVLPLMWIGLLVSAVGLPGSIPLQTAVFGAVAGYLCLWSIYMVFKIFTGREGMGFGDFKLLAALGAWMGWQALPSILIISTISGAIIGIAVLLSQGKNYRTAVPFGPFLLLGAVLTFINQHAQWVKLF